MPLPIRPSVPGFTPIADDHSDDVTRLSPGSSPSRAATIPAPPKVPPMMAAKKSASVGAIVLGIVLLLGLAAAAALYLFR